MACFASACASAPHAAPSSTRALTFDAALTADSAVYAPPKGFRAVADPLWMSAVGSSAATPPLSGASWHIDDGCAIRFDTLTDALAATERAASTTRRLSSDGCHGHTGFWQQAGRNVYWWMALGGGWSVEYYGAIENDSAMAIRRYALRADASRSWHVERASLITGTAHRVVPVVATRPRAATYAVTRAPRAIGESDWATRPGAGTPKSVVGTRWQDAAGCVLVFRADVLTRASGAQRLTRSLDSAGCGGVRGSWQQAGTRLFWVVNIDSTLAGETYAEMVNDSLLRARYYELRRDSPAGTWQATWSPSQSRTLRRLRR